MKIATIIGARPQFIKAAVVSRALRTVGVEEVLIHTGQHYDDNMSAVFFDDLELPAPNINLGIGSGTHGAQTGRMLEEIECQLLVNRPDMVVVYGDTNSTLAGALAAAKVHIPVAHIEAGLRSFNRRMPEEINRVLTDHASDLLFAPTSSAVENLLREGIPSAKIHAFGDVMYDAALFYGAKAQRQSHILQALGLERKQYALATVHRPENTENQGRLECLCSALLRLCEEIPIIFPIHPRTRSVLFERGMLERVAEKVRLIKPIGYLDMMMLEKNARVIVTDSGGVQKEAFFYRVPCVTVREETEWVELVETGWNQVTPPTNSSAVVESVRRALKQAPSPAADLFGDGRCAERVAEALRTSVGSSEKRTVVTTRN